MLFSVINASKPAILETKPWMCIACDRQACDMINTPRLDPSLQVITDLLPVFICASPVCAAEARRFSERVIKDTARDARASRAPDLRQQQMYICEYCETPKRRADGKLLRCGRCRAAWYCDRKCQRSHWKEHRVVCSPPLEVD